MRFRGEESLGCMWILWYSPSKQRVLAGSTLGPGVPGGSSW